MADYSVKFKHSDSNLWKAIGLEKELIAQMQYNIEIILAKYIVSKNGHKSEVLEESIRALKSTDGIEGPIVEHEVALVFTGFILGRHLSLIDKNSTNYLKQLITSNKDVEKIIREYFENKQEEEDW